MNTPLIDHFLKLQPYINVKVDARSLIVYSIPNISSNISITKKLEELCKGLPLYVRSNMVNGLFYDTVVVRAAGDAWVYNQNDEMLHNDNSALHVALEDAPVYWLTGCLLYSGFDFNYDGDTNKVKILRP